MESDNLEESSAAVSRRGGANGQMSQQQCGSEEMRDRVIQPEEGRGELSGAREAEPPEGPRRM